MNSSKMLLSGLVFASALGAAGALTFGFTTAGSFLASLGVFALGLADYSREHGIFRPVDLAAADNVGVSHLRLAA